MVLHSPQTSHPYGRPPPVSGYPAPDPYRSEPGSEPAVPILTEKEMLEDTEYAEPSFAKYFSHHSQICHAQSTSDIHLQSKAQDSEITRSTSMANRPNTIYVDLGELDHFALRKTTGDLHKYSDHRKSSGPGLIPLNKNIALSASSDNLNYSSKTSSGGQQKKSRKKRAAPLPPKAYGKNMSESQMVQIEINVQPKSTKQTQIVDFQLENSCVQLNKKIHSRNSSDSSDYQEYHEMTLSGTESPDAIKLDNLQTTLNTTSIDSDEHFNGDSGIPDSLDMDKATIKILLVCPLPNLDFTGG